jgi:hypothetical protein
MLFIGIQMEDFFSSWMLQKINGRVWVNLVPSRHKWNLASAF